MPSPPTTAVSPDARRTSCASHGSHATGRRVAVQVSPIMMPRRSPTDRGGRGDGGRRPT